MILTCPACSMRYLVSEGAIGPKGRRVRCANCGNQWTQAAEEGLDEELFSELPPIQDQFEEEDDIFETPQAPPPAKPQPPEDDSEDFQSILRKEIESTPIPEGVHPDLEDPVLAQLVKDRTKAVKLPSGQKTGGFIVAACFYFIVLSAALVLQPQISRAWPPSNLLYDLIGMKPVLPGEGLALDNLHAEMADGKISMKGMILNLKNQDVKVPSIMASIIDDDGKVIDRLLIPPPIARIKPEGSIGFDVVYPKLPENATDVTFGFSFIKVKPHNEEKPAERDGKEEPHAKPEKHEAPPAAEAPRDHGEEHPAKHEAPAAH